jgi:hypothetical protein
MRELRDDEVKLLVDSETLKKRGRDNDQGEKIEELFACTSIF